MPRGAGFSGSKPVAKSKRATGAALCVLSWIMALIAERFFLLGAARNIPMTRETSQGRGCHPVKDGVFMMGAVLSIVATVLGIISYIMLYAAAAGANTTTSTMRAVAGPSPAGEINHDGIAIGHPVAAQQHAQAV
ncbi:uncharacterized protein [Triticum aestivum]|uniref:uncharacterized protein n=2 Tax=Triticum TaxID=4564 RepID=UPI001D033C21|nr:uncharacterized protein LOC123093210 [Triticum aestivum]